jgi:hypothetical protein
MNPFEAFGDLLKIVPHLVKRADRAAISLYTTPKPVSHGGVQIRGCSRFQPQNPLFTSTLLKPLGTDSKPFQHLVKRADHAAISLFSTPKYLSQGFQQIRESSRCYYMCSSSQNPKRRCLHVPFYISPGSIFEF